MAYDFPPYVSVGGLRPYSWFKYFPEFGVQPIVVTRQWANTYGNELDYIAPGHCQHDVIGEEGDGYVIRTPYQPNLSNRLLLKYGASRFRLLRKTISAFYEFAQFILPVGPKRNIYKGARNYLKENKVDAIIATGDPFVLFHYAHKLSEEFNAPWIADYRDPWIDPNASIRPKILFYFNKILQNRICNNAAFISTVCTYFKNELEHTFNKKKIIIIPNGYDSESELSLNDTSQYADMLTISLVGSILNYHPIDDFLNTLENHISMAKREVRLQFYGVNNSEYYFKLIQDNYPLVSKNVVFHSRMNNLDLLIALQRTNVLLLFNYYLIPGTKIYDYLVVRRKILFCFDDEQDSKIKTSRPLSLKDDINEQIKIIENTNSGIVVKSSKSLLQTLDSLQNEFSVNNSIRCSSRNIERYSRKIGVSDLVNAIKLFLKNGK